MTGRPVDSAPVDTAPVEAVQRAARESYGRLVAILAARTGDVTLAEDVLSDAFLAALEQWPRQGVPSSPEGWLIAVARRRLQDRARHDAVVARAEPELAYAASLLTTAAAPDGEGAGEGTLLPDRRLDLMFACADPAIDPAVHTPLMLQAVLGLDAATIASAYLTPQATMSQRLVRAKRKIRDARIAFRIPEAHELPTRLATVLEALYAAFGVAWLWIDGGAPGGAQGRQDLRQETIALARIVAAALPQEPEALGLLALLLYCDARDAARRDAGGAYVPLSRQEATSWNVGQIHEAEQLLLGASRFEAPGRFQLEAAIQSAHLAAAFDRVVDLVAIAHLYDALVERAPTVAAYVNRAAAHARAFGPERGLTESERLPADAVRSYQPWWALRAHLLDVLQRPAEAIVARRRAIGLTEDPAVRAFLQAHPH